MSYRFEKSKAGTDLVISGFEKGIADSPYEGIADMRNVNIITSPKQGSVGFAMSAVTLPPTGYTATAFTASASTDVFTVTSTSGFYAGMGLTIVSASNATAGVTVGNTYYTGDITSTSFKLYKGLDLNPSGLLNINPSITGTFTVPTFGTPADSVSSPSTNTNSTISAPKETFIMTTNGLVWRLAFEATGSVAINSLQYMGNNSHSTAGNNNVGITIFAGYLLAWMNAKIDYLSMSLFNGTDNASANWQYGWKDTTVTAQGHRAITATDNAVYFCNGAAVGSILITAGSTFDPSSSATYTYNTSALALPANELATCLAQLGTNLLVGGQNNYIYPWDRVSTSYAYPIVVAESFIKCIVSTNSTAFVFAGIRGRIYQTNGANIDLYKKFPDALSDTVDPYYIWGWATYLKNQLYFSIQGQTNAATNTSNLNGVWAIDLDSGALRLSNSLSFATYAGTAPVIVPMGSVRPTGDGLYVGWLNSTGGIDYTSGDPYTNYEAYIDTDIIPVGTFLTKQTFNNIEFKLARPLVAGEGVKIYQRSDLTSVFTEVTITEGGQTGDISGVCSPVNFQNVQWIQLRITMASTASSPSYVPLLELRLRD